VARRFGPVSSFPVLHQRICLVDDPEWIQDIFVHRQHLFVRDVGATLVRELVGDGVLTREEPAHRERRRLLQPAFHRAQIASYAQAMVLETIRTSDEWGAGGEIDAVAEMKRLTLAIVGATLFGADFRQSATQIASVLERVIDRSRFLGPVLALVEPAALLYRSVLPKGPSLFFGPQRVALENILAPVIEARRKHSGEDMLSMLLSEFDDYDATNEIVTMVLAGHETTATALAWAWYLIGRRPEVEARIVSELESVLGHRDPAFDDLQRLSYTTKVFHEALRLYPPVPVFGRRPKEAVKIAGYDVPARTSILISPYITQRSERWFTEPERFDPDRWQNISIPKFAFFPFGGGAKMCIGESFARLEGVLILTTLARRWRMRLTEDADIGIQPTVTLRPDRPVTMRLEPRSVTAALPT
jgi:cytochrome P450